MWEDETPWKALGVLRVELPTLYTNSFISDVDGSFYDRMHPASASSLTSLRSSSHDVVCLVHHYA